MDKNAILSWGFAVASKSISPAILPSLNKSGVEISHTQINFGIAISQYTFAIPNGTESPLLILLKDFDEVRKVLVTISSYFNRFDRAFKPNVSSVKIASDSFTMCSAERWIFSYNGTINVSMTLLIYSNINITPIIVFAGSKIVNLRNKATIYPNKCAARSIGSRFLQKYIPSAWHYMLYYCHFWLILDAIRLIPDESFYVASNRGENELKPGSFFSPVPGFSGTMSIGNFIH